MYVRSYGCSFPFVVVCVQQTLVSMESAAYYLFHTYGDIVSSLLIFFLVLGLAHVSQILQLHFVVCLTPSH